MGCGNSRSVIALDKTLHAEVSGRIKRAGKSLDLSLPEAGAELPPFPALEVLPNEVLRKTDLMVLRLSRNSLRELPAAIAAMVNLTVLDVSQNRLASLPASLNELVRLEELDASEVCPCGARPGCTV